MTRSTISYGDANSYFLDDRILVDSELVAFTDRRWTARVAAALDVSIAFPREEIARLCLSGLFGFEFEGESLCDEAVRISPNPRAVRAVALADAIAGVLFKGRS